MEKVKSGKLTVLFISLGILLIMITGCNTDMKGYEEPAAKKGDTQTSTPWIDHSVKGRIKPGCRPDAKDDFYAFVNYDWLLNAEIQEGYSRESVFEGIERNTEKKVRALLTDHSIEGREAGLIRDFYDTILDWDRRNEEGMSPVIPVIEDIENIKTMEELSEFICDSERSALVPVFLNAYNSNSYKSPGQNVVFIEKDPLLLEDAAEYEELTGVGEALYYGKKELVITLMGRLGIDRERASYRFDRVMALEEQLASMSYSKAQIKAPDIYDKVSRIYTPKELEETVVSFPVSELIASLGYKEAAEYDVMEPEELKKLDELYKEDNLEVLKDYMIIKYLIFCSDKLDKECYEAYLKMQETISATKGSKDYENVAYNKVVGRLYEPVGYIYLREYASDDVKKKVSDLCEEIIKGYKEVIADEEWLSEAAKEKALLKLDNIRVNAVCPDKWRDYSGLEIKGLNYIDSVKRIDSYLRGLDNERTNRPVDGDYWNYGIFTCNAYYDPRDNSINIPLGILDGELYTDDLSLERLYGGLGAVIAHEISHSFDEKGSGFDEKGNGVDWWTKEDHGKFKEKSGRLMDYYNNMTGMDDIGINGENIYSEAMADMGALRVLLHMAKGIEDFDLDVFFRQYSRLWRCVVTPERESYILLKEEHPPNYLRVNATLQQFQEFYDTYDIKEGDGMYLAPKDRVSVW
ncbi:MAG: M13 family metallopeptidase [Lachnospiraceae bacterium]|nr:M13 family metallopeptidase [Lachnospiraceae bacterium]